MGFYDISFMSLKVVFLSSFIICDACVTKFGSSPIPCHKRSSATKTYFLVLNFRTILASSLIYDDSFSLLKISKTSQILVHGWCGSDVAALSWRFGSDVATFSRCLSPNIWWPSRPIRWVNLSQHYIPLIFSN
jgi:hypothetical protein